LSYTGAQTCIMTLHRFLLNLFFSQNSSNHQVPREPCSPPFKARRIYNRKWKWKITFEWFVGQLIIHCWIELQYRVAHIELWSLHSRGVSWENVKEIFFSPKILNSCFSSFLRNYLHSYLMSYLTWKLIIKS